MGGDRHGDGRNTYDRNKDDRNTDDSTGGTIAVCCDVLANVAVEVRGLDSIEDFEIGYPPGSYWQRQGFA